MTGTALRPRPHQLEALDALDCAFAAGPRAQLRMACGTGKTLIGYWHARRAGARTVVMLEPSIALVAQTLRAWQAAAAGTPMRALAVCSDPTTGRGRAEIGHDGWDPYGGRHDGAGVTTRGDVVARFLDGGAGPGGEDALTVVVGTYHSSEVVAEALRLTDDTRRGDLVVADEAHRLAGRPAPAFAAALRDDAIPARRRLFQTATPVVLGNLAGDDQLDDLHAAGLTRLALSMDDYAVFGPVAYQLSAGQAIGRGLLADYRVVVAHHAPDTAAAAGADHRPAGPGPAVRRRGRHEQAVLDAVSDTVRRFGARRVLTFHNRVAGARAFADRLTAAGTVGGLPVRAYAVDGSTPEARRREVLDRLGADGEDAVVVVSSAQVLREGVDVPAVDAAVFADPRSSGTAIVQAVGRVLRTHPGKTVGTVVVPLVLDGDGDDQERLADSAYAHVWRVLRGLRAHDTRIGFDLDRARASTRRGDGAGRSVDSLTLPWLHISGDDLTCGDRDAVLTRLVERSSAAWEEYYGLLQAAAARLGGAAAVVATHVEQQRPLGQWVVLQRVLHRGGDLDPDRAGRLAAVPGWRWSAAAAGDDRTVAVLAALAARTGSAGERPSGPSAYRGLKDGLHRPLGRWVATQIAQHDDGDLDPELAVQLQQLPGWAWHPHTGADEAALRALRRFAAWEGHCDVSDGHVEGGVRLGAWLNRVRRRKLLGQLPPALHDALLAATPTGPHGERRFAWRPTETWWLLGLDAIRGYLTDHGSLTGMAAGYEQLVDGHPVRLYQVIARLRHLHGRGELPADRAATLERFPGWQWRSSRCTRQAGDRLDLGDIPHGRRGFTAGCRCPDCLDQQRAFETAAAAAGRRRRHDAGVPCTDAARHLQRLLDTDSRRERADRTVTVGALAAAAGVSIGLVRGILDGDVQRCHPLHHAALTRLTVDDVAAVRCLARSRGRRAITGREHVDPAPTWAVIDRLRGCGWTIAELSDGLGYRRASTLPFTRDTVTARQAEQVTRLVDYLAGDETPPSGRADTAPAERAARRRGPAGHAGDAWALQLLEQGYSVEHAAARSGLSTAAVHALAAAVAA